MEYNVFKSEALRLQHVFSKEANSPNISCSTFLIHQKQYFGFNENYTEHKSKHLKGRSGPRVRNVFPSEGRSGSRARNVFPSELSGPRNPLFWNGQKWPQK